MLTTNSLIAENLRAVQQRIESACSRSDRLPNAVRLVAVTKYAHMEWVRALQEHGVIDLGESRPQQLLERVPNFGEVVRWHLIGQLQRNKARRVLPLTTLIHSVDSFRLLTRLESLAEELELRPQVLLQVNVSQESVKQGFLREELIASWSTVSNCRHVQVVGLMTMAPRCENAEATRPVFRSLRELRDQLMTISPADLPLAELSMGMSRDFEIAIEEGATIVRIGSGLFTGLESKERS